MSTKTFPSSPMMRALAAAVRANVPVLVWGPPGVGKTASLGAYADAWGYHFEPITGANREATDFLGLPIQTEDNEVSGRGESHPPALAEPDVNVSAHPAPIAQPSGRTSFQ